jgi:hypothetical protein
MIWALIIARHRGPVNGIGEKGRRRRLRFRGRCEANHTHLTGPALIRGQARPASVSKDRPDESAADGLLVVQVCPLGTVSRKIPQAAPPLIAAAMAAGPDLTRLRNSAWLASCVSAAGADRGRCGRDRPGPRSGEIRDKNRLKPINKANALTVKMRGCGWRNLPSDHAFLSKASDFNSVLSRSGPPAKAV